MPSGKLWNGVAIVSILVTLFTLFCVMTGRWRFPPGPLSGDDDFVVVLGGSMHISSEGFDRVSSHEAKHHKEERYLTYIGYGPNDGPLLSAPIRNGTIKIDLTYCDALPCQMTAGHYETVSLDVLGNHKKLRIRNPNGSSGVGDEAYAAAQLGHNYWDHQPSWHIGQIAITGLLAPYACPTGQCRVMLQMHCDTPGDCE